MDWNIKNIPDDIHAIVKKEKLNRELECKCTKSIAQVIFHIIREFKKKES